MSWAMRLLGEAQSCRGEAAGEAQLRRDCMNTTTLEHLSTTPYTWTQDPTGISDKETHEEIHNEKGIMVIRRRRRIGMVGLSRILALCSAQVSAGLPSGVSLNLHSGRDASPPLYCFDTPKMEMIH